MLLLSESDLVRAYRYTYTHSLFRWFDCSFLPISVGAYQLNVSLDVHCVTCLLTGDWPLH